MIKVMERGIIQLLVIFVLVIVILSLLGVSLGKVFQNKMLNENFSFVFQWVKYLWDNFLQKPASFLWDIFRNIVLKPASNILKNLETSSQ